MEAQTETAEAALEALVAQMEPLIDAVKLHAKEHYNDGGWDVVVECHTDWEILVFLASPWPEKPDVETVEQAIDRFEPLVDVWSDRQADARFYRENW